MVHLFEVLSNFTPVKTTPGRGSNGGKSGAEVTVGSLKHANRKLSRPEVEALIEAYRAGKHLKALAARFGLHEQTVKAHLLRAGIELRPWPILDDEQVARAGRLYVQGWSLAEVAVEFACDASTMRRTLHRAGVEIRPRGRFRIRPEDGA